MTDPLAAADLVRLDAIAAQLSAADAPAQASDVGVKAITAGRGKSHSLICDQTEIGHQVPAL